MNGWHASANDLADYRRGAAEPVVASSVETHLIACEHCRRELARVGGAPAEAETERRWAALAEAVDAADAGGLSRIGLSARPLLRSWLLAVVLVVLVPLVPAVVVGLGITTMVLATAPLAPLAAVALTYHASTDPAGELSLATPMAGLRAMAGRGLLVGLAALPVGVGLALVLRVPTVVAFAWVLPGLALAGLVLLAGTTRVDPAYVATGLGAAWAIAVTLPSFHGSPAGLEVAHRLAEPAVQLLTLAVAVTAVGLVAARRDKLSYRRQA